MPEPLPFVPHDSMGMESFMMIDPTIQDEDRKSGFLITDGEENFFSILLSKDLLFPQRMLLSLLNFCKFLFDFPDEKPGSNC